MAYKKSNPNGQATMANSEPIVIASDQSAVPVSGNITANIGTVGTLATAAKQDLLLTELQLKADLTETQPVSIAGSVAVTGPLTDTQLRATPVPVSNASLPLPAGASTSALQTTGNTSLSNIDTKVPALGQALAAASTPVVLTAAQISTLTPQTNALTDGQLRATPVPVSGTVSTGGLTDTQIRATPLPVSGTVTVANPTANPETGLAKDGTDITTPSPAMPAGGVGIRGWLSAIWTKLNASLAVTGTFWQATQPVSGTFFQATQPVSLATNTPVIAAGTAVIGKIGLVDSTGVNNASIDANGALAIQAGGAAAAAVPLRVIQIGGTDGTNLRTLRVSTAGVVSVDINAKATYRASTIIPLVAAVTVNVPFFNIIGSATRTVTVKRITVSGMTLTAVGYFAINVEKLSTASSAGTSTTLVATSLDSNNAAVTAVVKAYTAAPTKGTLVGTLRSWRALWQATTAAAAGTTDYYDFNFGDNSGNQGIVLRGVAQEIALTFPVVLASAGTLSINIEWTEE